ncbi:MAG: cupin domain-containing protein [Rhizobacter sp.]
MRSQSLIEQLGLVPHPEGGHYREFFRSSHGVTPDDGRPHRSALTCIDFLLQAGEFSAWHRVSSDEAWHFLEGDPLKLWCVPPSLDRVEQVILSPASATTAPRHVVPAGWWQAAGPLGEYAYVGATVGPGFEFADFSFGRDDEAFMNALARLDKSLQRLAGTARS